MTSEQIERNQASIPEIMRIVMEFEKSRTGDHEMYPKFQGDFRRDVLLLVDDFEKL